MKKMMNKAFLITLFVSLAFSAHSNLLKTSVFCSLENSSATIDLETAKTNKTFFIAHDCKACHRLLLKLKRDCKSLDVVTFAVGDKKNLKSKLKILKSLKSPVYLGSTTEAYSDIGIDLIPFYISKDGKRYESGVLAAMMKDNICKREKKGKI